MATESVILTNAPVACYLAANAIEKNGVFGRGFLDDKLAIKIRFLYKFIKKIYDLDPNYSGMYQNCQYLWEVCGIFGVQAMSITNSGSGGGSITPVTPTSGSLLNWIEVRKSDFFNATEYRDSRLKGKDLSVDGNWLGEKIVVENVQWMKLNDGGVKILVDGFDAKSDNFDNTEIIIRILINGSITAGDPVSTYTYDLTADTLIPNMPTGTANQIRNVVVRPNGFNYTWDSNFKFTDNWPPQPDANAANTEQIYTFMYRAGVGDVCIGQSLNIAI